jgi:16S rRNA C967 or C1407 C5-methylase (RsmB/RsmF family)
MGYDHVRSSHSSLSSNHIHINTISIGWETFEKKVLDPARLAALAPLQRALLWNGFRLLSPNDGVLVYSTCSFCVSQNEAVVQWLLDHEPSAYLMPVTLPQSLTLHVQHPTPSPSPSSAVTSPLSVSSVPTTGDTNNEQGSTTGTCNDAKSPVMSSASLIADGGSLPHTLRFSPFTSGTSGLFIAKIGRKPIVSSITSAPAAPTEAIPVPADLSSTSAPL